MPRLWLQWRPGLQKARTFLRVERTDARLRVLKAANPGGGGWGRAGAAGRKEQKTLQSYNMGARRHPWGGAPETKGEARLPPASHLGLREQMRITQTRGGRAPSARERTSPPTLDWRPGPVLRRSSKG